VRRIGFHRGEHLFNSDSKADGDRAADDAVTDIQLDEVRHLEKAREILVIEAVAGIYTDSGGVSGERGVVQTLDFIGAVFFAMKMFGEAAGVEFDEIYADLFGGFDLLEVGRDEEAHLDAGAFETVGATAEWFELAGCVEAAFCGHFLASFGDEADNVWFHEKRDLNDFGRIAHLEVKPGFNDVAQFPNVAVLNVAAVFAEMRGDAVSASRFANERGFDGIGFAAFHAAIAGFAESGDVIDVNAELEH